MPSSRKITAPACSSNGSGRGPVTFVYAAKDEQRNSAVVLKGYLEGKAGHQ
jgi:uncharacterized protein YeaO (DUF488 family)